MNHTTPPRTLPVSPTIHVETFADHFTLAWQDSSIDAVFETARRDALATATSSVEIDATDTAGREQTTLAEATDDDTIRYLRIDPPSPWTLSWERRTTPTVTLSGTPPVPICRQAHVGTTDCQAWNDEAVRLAETIVGRYID